MERQPHSLHERSQPPIPFIEGDVQDALTSDPMPVRDRVFGDGEGHWFGPQLESLVEFYPEHRAVMITTPTLIVSLRAGAEVTAGEHGLAITAGNEREGVHITATREGVLSVSALPITPAYDDHTQDVLDLLEQERERAAATPWELDQDANQDIDDSDHHGPGGRVNGGDAAPGRSAPVEDPTLTASVEPLTEPTASGSRKEKQPRVEFTGRLGRVPHFKQTPRGTIVARFPVAEHTRGEDGEEFTTWYTVAAFNKIAEEIQAQLGSGDLKQGDELRIVGYQHQRMVPDGKGGIKAQDEIFAAIVKKPTLKTT